MVDFADIQEQQLTTFPDWVHELDGTPLQQIAKYWSLMNKTGYGQEIKRTSKGLNVAIDENGNYYVLRPGDHHTDTFKQENNLIWIIAGEVYADEVEKRHTYPGGHFQMSQTEKNEYLDHLWSHVSPYIDNENIMHKLSKRLRHIYDEKDDKKLLAKIKLLPRNLDEVIPQ